MRFFTRKKKDDGGDGGGLGVFRISGIVGVNQLLVSVAIALFIRLVTTPDPVLLESPDDDPASETVSSNDAEGKEKVTPVTLQWGKISCTLSDSRGRLVRFLLSNVNGEAKPGKLLALMGPSGSGKTTLLNVLAGQVVSSPRLRLTGHIGVNGRPRPRGGIKVAYVRQDDIFFSQLTVRETLSLAAELQLSHLSSAKHREDYVKKLLFRLGLINCADSIVGDAKVRGISGGEKKRLSLACELIASPSVIFADEPTTGLDAFQIGRAHV